MFDTGREQLKTYRLELSAVVMLLAVAVILYGGGMHSRAELSQITKQVQANNTQIQQLEASLRTVQENSPNHASRVSVQVPKSLDIPSVLMEQATVAAHADVVVNSFQFTPDAQTNGSGGGASPGSSVAGAPSPAPAASSAGVSAQGEGNRSGLQAYPVNVTVTGPTQRILEFIRELDAYPRLTTVNRIAWTHLNPKGKSTAEVTYNVYTASS